MNLTPLITSKRMWTMVITFLLHEAVSHYGLHLGDEQAVIDNLVIACGAIALAITKILDSVSTHSKKRPNLSTTPGRK